MTDQIFSQGIRKTHEPVGDGMSQQGTGQREANQTKDGEYVTSDGHPRSLVLLWGILHVGLLFPSNS